MTLELGAARRNRRMSVGRTGRSHHRRAIGLARRTGGSCRNNALFTSNAESLLCLTAAPEIPAARSHARVDNLIKPVRLASIVTHRRDFSRLMRGRFSAQSDATSPARVDARLRREASIRNPKRLTCLQYPY
jgi:hypothetical protein